MPVEIREISISLTVLDEEPGGKAKSEAEENRPLDEDSRRELVDECVRAVMEILKDRREA